MGLFGFLFEFNLVEGKIGNLIDLSKFGIVLNEVIVVYCMYYSLYDISGLDMGILRVLGVVRFRLVIMVE